MARLERHGSGAKPAGLIGLEILIAAGERPAL
jgi:hypothetical protein